MYAAPNDILITNNGDESHPNSGIVLNDKCVYAWYNEQVSVSIAYGVPGTAHLSHGAGPVVGNMSKYPYP